MHPRPPSPPIGDHLSVAVLGLGEAGGAIARDLAAAGAAVFGWDPNRAAVPDGVRPAATAAEAVAQAGVVLSLNSAEAALAAAESSAATLSAQHLFCDLNTASATVKRQVAEAVAHTGARFADVALIAPVPGRGLRTPALASGPGADEFARVFAPLGMPVDVLGDVPGDAANRKLIRSIFTKGIAAAAIESLAVARAAGCEPWARQQIADALSAADAALLDRLLDGSSRHAARRVDEMDAAAVLARELGVVPRISAATAETLRGLREASDT
jgi:3-hydroxyisobutyrate dehydrogenase-like beta-hydroxyacid dehydrogenase